MALTTAQKQDVNNALCDILGLIPLNQRRLLVPQLAVLKQHTGFEGDFLADRRGKSTGSKNSSKGTTKVLELLILQTSEQLLFTLEDAAPLLKRTPQGLKKKLTQSGGEFVDSLYDGRNTFRVEVSIYHDNLPLEAVGPHHERFLKWQEVQTRLRKGGY